MFLQAVDGGLDLVAVAGASVMDPDQAKAIAAVARNGVSIKEPKDFVGKKVGAPGIGAFLHVLFRKWLIEKGVDPKSVNFVEVTFPTMNDALKSGSVDAVLTGEPFITRITKAGNGEVAALYAADLARNDPIIFYAATREFAEAHPDVDQGVPRFDRGGGADRQFRPRKAASPSIAKFTKMPIDIVRLNRPDVAKPELKGADLAWWVETMKQQDMLQGASTSTSSSCLESQDSAIRWPSAPPSRSRPTFSAARSLPIAASASPRRRRATASARRRFARRCRGLSRAASSTRSASADSGSIGFARRPRRHRAHPQLLEREALRLSIAARRRRLGGRDRRRAAPAQALHCRATLKVSAKASRPSTRCTNGSTPR